MVSSSRNILDSGAVLSDFINIVQTRREDSNTTMVIRSPAEEIDCQLPDGEEIFLDHVGHFVRDPTAASGALARAGFAPTPPSVQVNPDGRGGDSPTGTGNVTAMLRRGYVECLFKTADTALGRELDTAMARYPGVHLAAFSVAAAAAAHQRLGRAGFRVRPLVDMQRPVATEGGPGVAAFTVARLEPGEMPEGRIQILTHRTEAAVWQPRWLAHPNGAVGLVDLVLATSDAAGTAERFSRFLDRPARKNAAGIVIALDRGRVQLVAPQALAGLVPGLILPPLPFIGLYAVAVTSLDRLAGVLARGGLAFTRNGGHVLARFPDSLGTGAWMFVESPAALPWRA